MPPIANRKSRIGNLLPSLPVWLVVLLCSGLPLGWLAWQIVSTPQVLTETRLDAFRAGLLARTVGYNLSAAVIATALALPAALVIGRGRGMVPILLWFVLPLSLLLPSMTYAYGWQQAVRLSGVVLDPAGPGDVARCVWSLATWLWPLPAAVIGLSLRRLDASVQQQALLDGALGRVTARQLLGPVVASAAIVGVLALQEFAVYEPTGISVIATEVRMVFDTGAFSSLDNPITAPMGMGAVGGDQAQGLSSLGFVPDQRARAAAAVATAVPLLLVIAGLTVVAWWGVRSASGADAVDVANWPRVLDAGWVSKALALLVVIVAVVVPVVALTMSLRRPLDLARVWAEFQPPVLGSMTVAAMTGAVVLVLAVLGLAGRAPGALLLLVITFLVGGQLLAIAQIRLYNRPWLGFVYNAPPIIVMAYVARFGWVALLAARGTWWRPWRELRQQAAVDGAGPVATAAYVVAPLAWPILGAAAVLVAILSLTEVPATVLISPQRPQLLTPLLMTWVHMLRYDPMIEGSLLLAGVVSALSVVVVGLGWMGVRVVRGRVRSRAGADAGRRFALPRRGMKVLSVGGMVVLLSGCSDSSQPQAIWCEPSTAAPQVIYPRAIAYSDVDDTFVVIDRTARVQRMAADGTGINEWRMPDWHRGKPVGVSVGPDGNVYVPDTHYHRVMVYSPDGQLLRSWGSLGGEPGQFIFPTDVAFDAAGNVFVSEYGDNDRIQVFTPAGEFLYAFGRYGQGDGEFMRPQSIVIDRETDLLYVTDSCNHRINVFRTDGTFVRNMGGVGSGPGQFRFPYGLDMDGRGRLVVCEFGNNRVQLIDADTGKGLATWGAAGHDPGQLAYPWSATVDRHDRVVAVDSGNNRLQVFEF